MIQQTSKEVSCEHQINPVVVNTDQGALTFKHAVEIEKPMGTLDTVLDWCKQELLDHTWRWQMRNASSFGTSGQYIFYFNSERDYLAFILKWR